MRANDNKPMGEAFTVIAVIMTLAVLAVLTLLSYFHFPEIKNATVIELGKLAGGVGTFLALVWLICGHLQQAVRLRGDYASDRVADRVCLPREPPTDHRVSEHRREPLANVERRKGDCHKR